jgi:hypothetical protein
LLQAGVLTVVDRDGICQDCWMSGMRDQGPTYLDGFLFLQLDISTVYSFLHVFHDDGPTPAIDEDSVAKCQVVSPV